MRTLHVGICGAGMGGLAAAIALRKVGAQVTVLEAAEELGEIGAGIQVRYNPDEKRSTHEGQFR